MNHIDSGIVDAMERRIRERTWGRIHNLRVEIRGELIIVYGSTQTYHFKQLALEAAREALGTSRPFLININVI
jgi:hypothetical protein